MNTFEDLKSNTIQYSIFDLLRVKLSPQIIDDLFCIEPSFQTFELLTKEITSKEDIQKLEAFLKTNKSKLNQDDLYNACLDDLREIKEDFKWLSTKKGKLIINIEHWILMIRPKLKSRFSDDLIFVGRSFDDPNDLIVGGCVRSQSILEDIENFVEAEFPPVVPTYKFIIESR